MNMNKMTLLAAALSAALSAAFSAGFSLSAFADTHTMNNPNSMAGMNMNMPMTTMSEKKPSSTQALTDATVVSVDKNTGMITLKHGALSNIHMPAMTMAYKAKNAEMLDSAKAGAKVQVLVESVDNTLTITTLQEQQ